MSRKLLLTMVVALAVGGMAAGAHASPGSAQGTVTEEWVARYDGPASGNDEAYALAVDGSGNVYVTGGSQGDYGTVKYNASGVEQWVARYNGPGNGGDWAYALAVDGSGNVYVTGESGGAGTSQDYATVKYNAAGVEQWVARYNGAASGSDEAYALAVDGSGNVYVTGGSYGAGTDYDYATVKYNASGAQQWVARYNGPGNYWDEATDVAVDASGNVYVTGYCDFDPYPPPDAYTDYATVKYNASGVQQWVARYDGPASAPDGAEALAVDGTGNVYVTGGSNRDGHFDVDYATVKYNTSGVQQWVARYIGPASDEYDNAFALAVDGSGNVYVTGNSYGGDDTSTDYATVKYNGSGVEQWVARYNGPGNYWDEAYDVAVDASGSVYVTGQSWGAFGHYDYATVRYDASGVQEWVARYDGAAEGCDDYASALAVDGSGNVYVTGGSYDPGTFWDYATIKYVQTTSTPTATPTATPTSTPTAMPTATPPSECIDRLGDTACDDPVNDNDDDGCVDAEEQAGASPPKPGATGAYDPTAWYDFYDVPVPAKADASGANGKRDRAVAMDDVLAVLFYVGTYEGDAAGDPNANGVRYDTIKGVDLDGDTTNDIPPPLHQIKEGVKYDRSPGAEPNPPWEAGPPSGAVAMDDVLAVLAQVGLSCVDPP